LAHHAFIYANGGALQKSAEKKIEVQDITGVHKRDAVFYQCISWKH
jgi:hypothetical protein